MSVDMPESIPDPDIPRPWLARYPAGMPSAIEVPQGSLYGLFAAAAGTFADRPFLDFYGKRIRYGEAASLIRRAADGLRRLGAGPGTRIGLCLPNSPGSVLCYFAALAAGGTVVNFSPLAAEQQIDDQIADSGTEIMVTVDLQPLFARMVGALGSTGLRHIVACRMAAMLPFPRSVVFRVREHARLATLPRDPRVIDFAALTADSGLGGPPAPRSGRDIAVIQYTGGTTGPPKGVMLSHENLLANSVQLRAWFTHANPGDERFLGVLPFFHSFGMTGVMNLAVALGGELVILSRFRPPEVLRAIERSRVTMLIGVPAMFRALAECPAIERADLSSLKLCVSGGDALPPDLAQRIAASSGALLAEGYGLTECGPVVSCNNPLEGISRPGSCGLPLPGTDVAIMSSEQPGTILPSNEIGEICIRGPQVTSGYWRRPEATRDALRDGWLHSGDLGRMDRDGFLYFVSRQPDAISVRGYKVYARTIEDAIGQHPAVAEVAVAGQPDAVRGEVPRAFIVIREGMTLDGATLRAFLADKLSPIEIPRNIEFRTQLPKSEFGKILKRRLDEGGAPETAAPR
jgi:long-chain acyl-CoA synthetase